MFNSEPLSIVIGLTFIYLLYSLLATILQEIIATWFNFRAKILEKALNRMLHDRRRFEFLTTLGRLMRRSKKSGQPQNLVEAFYQHPLIKFLSEGSRSKPSYLTKETFSKIMLDLLKGKQPKPGDDMALFIQSALDRQRIEWADIAIPENSDTLWFLRSIWADAQGDVDKFRRLLENWFDETMARASEWYKKYTQIFLLVIGIGIAAIFNVDTITIVSKLEKDPALREQLVIQAENFIKKHPNLDEELRTSQAQNNLSIPDSLTRAEKNRMAEQQYQMLKQRQDTLIKQADALINTDIKKVNELLSIGRKTNTCADFWSWCTLKRWTGWLLTALAISLGAPFWFDLLNKLMKLRGATPASSDKSSDKPSDTDATLKIERKG